MVNSKDYRVVVVEPLLCPSNFRNTLARALFNHFTVRERDGGREGWREISHSKTTYNNCC